MKTKAIWHEEETEVIMTGESLTTLIFGDYDETDD